MQRVTLLDGNTNDALIELTPGQPFVGDRLVQRVAQKYFGGANNFNQPTTGNNPSQPPTGTIDGL